ncbi:MAG: hypothetical protein H7645_02855 [Candidatus Heimdallarchaeota archaeon]|nr:hypothetical protein [Candidatus Heimdallarchaeota archaeon]MCK4769255.1 hypothetical protein [Candidatus Heimdallarchaeota archaeon]
MGGFFLTNNKSEILEKEIIKNFNKKEMKKHTILNLEDYRLFYFHKINISTENHIFKKNGDFLIGIGTFFFNNKFGYAALEEIYENYLKDQDFLLFNKVMGHFNLILSINGKVAIVTDKTGSYHSFYSISDKHIYCSTSFYSIIEILEQITINKQELIEFMMFEAFIFKTPVKEIEFLKFGCVHLLDNRNKMTKKEYFKERTLKKQVTIDTIYEEIKKYFAIFTNLDISLSVDLSAGYDTRLVGAIFKNMNLKHILNTNENTTDPLDSAIPIEIAKEENREIIYFQRKKDDYNLDELIFNSFEKNELIRDNFGGCFSSVIFDEKTKKFNMIVGGYGGELYRDSKYKKTNTIDYLVTKQYTIHPISIILKKKDYKNYRKKLKQKFFTLLGEKKNKLNREELERIYYFLKMMYWGGGRISFFNRYGYRFHPLLDYELTSYVLRIGRKEKDDEKFMMQVIEKFDKEFASYRSNYGYNFVWSEEKRNIITPKETIREKMRPILRIATRIFIKDEYRIFKTKNLLKNIIKRKSKMERVLEPEIKTEKTWREYSEQEFQFTEIFGKRLNNLRLKESSLGRVYTVEYFLKRYKSKMKSI